MKTKIIGFTLGLALIISPVLVHADTLQDQYVSALHQIITLLQQQVQLLLAQLNALQVAPPASPVPPTIISPVVIPPPPVFGNTPPAPIPALAPTPVPPPLPIPVVYPAYIPQLEIEPSSPSHNSGGLIMTMNQDNWRMELFSVRLHPNSQEKLIDPLQWKSYSFNYQIISDDYSKLDVIPYCIVDSNTYTFSQVGDCHSEFVVFQLINRHPGKLHIIITSAILQGMRSGVDYPASGTPLDSGEILITQ